MSERKDAKQVVHDLMQILENPPEDECLMAAYVAMKALEGVADDGAVDSGYGFGESCLDFWIDDKAIRVVVSRVPEIDKPLPPSDGVIGQ